MKGQLRLVVLTIVVYIAIGVIVFPGWWYGAVREGGLTFLLLQAGSDYFLLNLTAVALATALIIWYRRSKLHGTAVAQELDQFLDSQSYFGAIALLLVLSVFRYQVINITAGTPWSTDPSAIARLSKAVQLPVDIVWLDERRLVAAYDQVAPELKLREITTTQGQKTGAEVEANTGPIKGKSSLESTGSQTENYSTIDPSVVRKAVDLINGLSEQQELRQLRTVESQSADVKALDDAVATLQDKFGLLIENAKVAAARRALVEKNIETELPKELNEASWVLISGDVTVLQQATATNLSFEYVPSIPGKAVFSCQVPQSGTSTADLRTLPDKSVWQLMMFGRLLQRPSVAKVGQYTLLCYAVLR